MDFSYITGFLNTSKYNKHKISMLKTQQNHYQFNGFASPSLKQHYPIKSKGLNPKQLQNRNQYKLKDDGADTKKFKEYSIKKAKKLDNQTDYFNEISAQKNLLNQNILRKDEKIKKDAVYNINPESKNQASFKRISSGTIDKLFPHHSRSKQSIDRFNLISRSSTKLSDLGQERQTTPNRLKGRMVGLSNYLFTSQKNLKIQQDSRQKKIQQQYVGGYKILSKQLDSYKKLYNQSVQKLKKSQQKRQEENQKFQTQKKIYIQQIKNLKQNKNLGKNSIGHLYTFNDYEIQNLIPNSIIVEKKSEIQSELQSLKQISETQTVESSGILSINSNQQ